MSEDNGSSDRPNRRTFLSALGAATGGIALSGFGSISVTASDAATDQQVEAALSSTRVQTIFDELGELAVDADDAEHVVLSGEEQQYNVTRMGTAVGTLAYITDDSGTEEAMLRIGDEDGVGQQSLDALPEQYRDLPADAGATYLAGEGGDALFRSPTTAEREAIADAVGTDPEELYAFAFDQQPGFQVLLGDDDVEAYTVTPARGNADDAVYREISAASLRSGDVSAANWGLVKCGSICLTCVTAVRTCVKCAVPCAGSVTGIGAIACAVCLVAACGGGAAACGLCYANCRHHL